VENHIETVMEAIDYIENHLPENLSLDVIAEAVHYSKYHLHRMFVQEVGLTIHDYVQRRQLTEAAKLLVFSGKPIMEIALTAGYESRQAFTAVFKEMYKKTPDQYRKAEAFYPLQLPYCLHRNPIGRGGSCQWRQRITFAVQEDIRDWMELVRLVIDGFPYLQEEEYVTKLRQYIARKEALILKEGDRAIGVMAFRKEGSIDFLGVHPQYRRRGIAGAFLRKLLDELVDSGRNITVTTFREGDKADTGYRNAYKRMGFAEGELLVEFGYPTQLFVLQRESGKDVKE